MQAFTCGCLCVFVFAACVTLVAISEGCNHVTRSCRHSCGCSYVKHADGSKVFSENDHANGYARGGRGTTVVVFDRQTLAMVKEVYFVFTNMGGLISFLNGIPDGMVVSVTTVDEPFAYWRGKAKKAANAALESMGIPAPNQGKNPEYRGAYAGFGLSGCQTRGTCPEWAGSVYTGRFGWPATYSAKICTGSCAHAGMWSVCLRVFVIFHLDVLFRTDLSLFLYVYVCVCVCVRACALGMPTLFVHFDV